MYADIYQEDYSLFDYQSHSKKEIFNAWDSHRAILFQMPTGTGKTRLFSSIVRDIIQWGVRTNNRVKILVIAHRKELVDQISDCLGRYQISHGKLIGSEKKDFLSKVIVASIQTLSQSAQAYRYKSIDPNFVIIDEAHHSIAPSYKRLWDYYSDSKFLGVTATPWSMTGLGFDTLYGMLIKSLQPKEFILKKRLVPFVYYSIRNSDEIYLNIHQINDFYADGDYSNKILEQKFDCSRIRAKLLDSYLRFAKGKRGIIYSISREHSRHICAEYEKAGFRITDIDGKTPKAERERKVNEFKKGNLDIIVNVDIFSEGFDCPDIEFIQLGRPTKSLVKYLQQVGRGLRVSASKTGCIILDNVGAFYDFGLPDDDRDWDSFFHGKNLKEGVLMTSVEENKKEKCTYRLLNLTEGDEEMCQIKGFETETYGKDTTLESSSSSSGVEDIICRNKENFVFNYERKNKRR